MRVLEYCTLLYDEIIMSQNILLVIRQDIAAVKTQLDELSAAVADVKSNLPDVSVLVDKIDGQSAVLETLQDAVEAITEILNPTIPPADEVVPNVNRKVSNKK
ncbi:P10 [Helicoverpa armigera SNPV]|nr:P10 [Helicoverpa SNPV AC53]AIG63199.2 P10 [Helicoverpa armigera SNPV]AMN15326.2 P10 [Helicoverpa SNPV AC53]AMN15464.2 P10 [Helicoverpa SNPV AC53]AMN15602.2 P10 [Helicoverpa SNPV AC53]